MFVFHVSGRRGEILASCQLSALVKHESQQLYSLRRSSLASIAVQGLVIAIAFLVVRGCERFVPAGAGAE